MFGQLTRTFRALFTTVGAKTAVLSMIVLMAFIPVAELLVIRMFSHLVVKGKAVYEENPGEVYQKAVIFFVLFAVTRALHHWGRFARVIAIKRAFRVSSGDQAASRAAWEWALAFELSIVFVALIQVTALSGLFVVIDGIVGLTNALIVVVVIFVIARLYQRNLDKQLGYVKSQTPTSTEVGDRVGQRIRDAETGAAVSSLAMAIALAAVLYFALRGDIVGADAVVMLLGMRVLYGQLGQLSAGAMRFGRATARRGGGDDPTDEFADDELEEEPGPKTFSDAKRTELVNRMLAHGQTGELEGVRQVADLLSRDGLPSQDELRAQHAAEAFAHYGRGSGAVPTSLLWQARPFPGVATDWLNPLLLQHFSGSPVSFADPPVEYPHLVMHGRLGRRLSALSIVVGTGAMPTDDLDPSATYVSVRGPRSAERVAGIRITRFGDPLMLAARAIPLRRKETNGRLALVRHPEHTKTAVELGERIDEVSVLAARPDALRSFVGNLAEYDGVLTTSLAVMTVCQSFGLPCAPITFGEPSPVQAFAYEDHALGLGLPVVLPTRVDTDLGATNFDDLVATVTVDPGIVDDIEDALHTAVEIYTERYDDLSETADAAEFE